jgi:hypothetical protein
MDLYEHRGTTLPDSLVVMHELQSLVLAEY